MVELEEKHFIGQGKNRACYRHPDDKNLCIKIMLPQHKKKYNENVHEFQYVKKHLAGKNARLPISKPVAWVETNLGTGLSYELILDYDGKISKTLAHVRDAGLVSMDILIEEVEKLKNEFLAKEISPTEISLENIMLQRTSPVTHRLMFVDGYGLKNYNPVFNLSKRVRKKQIARRFDRRLRQMERELDSQVK